MGEGGGRSRSRRQGLPFRSPSCLPSPTHLPRETGHLETGKADKLAAGRATQWEAQKARGSPVPRELRWAPSEAS